MLRGAAIRQHKQDEYVTCVFRCYSQVQGIEEKDNIFSFVVRQLQLLEFPINDGCSLKVWCGL